MIEHQFQAFDRLTQDEQERVVGVTYDYVSEIDGDQPSADDPFFASLLLKSLFVFSVGSSRINASGVGNIQRRFFAAVLLINPDIFGNQDDEVLDLLEMPNEELDALHLEFEQLFLTSTHRSLEAVLNHDQIRESIDEILAFIVYKHKVGSLGIIRMTQRFFAIFWLIRSELLLMDDGKPASLRSMSQFVGCTFCWLSTVAEEFSVRYKVQTRPQKRLSTRPSYSKATKTWWKTRREKEASEEK